MFPFFNQTTTEAQQSRLSAEIFMFPFFNQTTTELL